MTAHEASRTLVKSRPELWAQCSDAASLARHLDHFGKIRITRLEPETAVAWEGEHASGTVRLEPSGWGTRVVLTAIAVHDEDVEVAAVQAEPPPESESPPRPSLLARWIGLMRRGGTAPRGVPARASTPQPQPAPSPPPPDHALVGALESLGRAHHRPYSRR